MHVKPLSFLLYLSVLIDMLKANGCQGIYLDERTQNVMILLYADDMVHSAISECHSHPLRFCVAFTHIQHQGSLSSVTSPSSNQQPAIHKSGTSGEVDRDWPVVFKCTPAHPLPTHGNLCTQCSSYKSEGIDECSTFNFIFIDN